MTQISRPFQIALLAMGLFAAVWFFALQGHSSSTSSSSSSPSAPAVAPASGSSAAAGKAAAPSSVYHGAAPGVEGLSRAIAKAHEAVATSDGNAKALAEKSAQASSASSTGTTGASAPGSAPTAAAAPATAAKTTTHATTSHTVKVHVRVTHSSTATKVASGAASTKSAGTGKSVPANQAMVESELKQGKIVTILFWNAKASVDRTVHSELQAVGRTLGGKLAVHDARAAQVGSFGSITRDVQVFATPTILIVNKQGHTTTLTGLADSFSITQAIAEARTA